MDDSVPAFRLGILLPLYVASFEMQKRCAAPFHACAWDSLNLRRTSQGARFRRAVEEDGAFVGELMLQPHGRE